MSHPTWRLKTDDVPKRGKTSVVDSVTGEGSTAIFLRVSQNAQPEGSVLLPDGSYALAYLNVCTHMSCRLVRGKSGRLHSNEAKSKTKSIVGPCPCHGTSFDLLKDGLVVFGPATQNLPRLELTGDEAELTATLKQPDLDPHRENWSQES